MSNDKTNDDIKSGAGLKPLTTSSGTTPSGVTTEQKGQPSCSGVRRDIFTLQTTKEKDDEK